VTYRTVAVNVTGYDTICTHAKKREKGEAAPLGRPPAQRELTQDPLTKRTQFGWYRPESTADVRGGFARLKWRHTERISLRNENTHNQGKGASYICCRPAAQHVHGRQRIMFRSAGRIREDDAREGRRVSTAGPSLNLQAQKENKNGACEHWQRL
jgi:hypothetical protein